MHRHMETAARFAFNFLSLSCICIARLSLYFFVEGAQVKLPMEKNTEAKEYTEVLRLKDFKSWVGIDLLLTDDAAIYRHFCY